MLNREIVLNPGDIDGVGPRQRSELVQCLDLQLSNSLFCNTESTPHLFQSQWFFPLLKTETVLDDLAFSFFQLIQDMRHGFLLFAVIQFLLVLVALLVE